jgi:transposase
METAFRNNRRRVRRAKGKRLQRQRSAQLEWSFAHVCETGGARRTWLRGLENINKRYQIHAAARNLGLLMRDLFGVGKPRVLQGGWGLLCFAYLLAGLIQGLLTRSYAFRSVWNFTKPQHAIKTPINAAA